MLSTLRAKITNAHNILWVILVTNLTLIFIFICYLLAIVSTNNAIDNLIQNLHENEYKSSIVITELSTASKPTKLVDTSTVGIEIATSQETNSMDDSFIFPMKTERRTDDNGVTDVFSLGVETTAAFQQIDNSNLIKSHVADNNIGYSNTQSSIVASTSSSVESVTIDLSEMKTKIKYSDILVKKSNWSTGHVNASCRTRLELPITKIYVSETNKANCIKCRSTVLDMQTYDTTWKRDIQYNFVIGGDGLIFEGLSWSCKVDNEATDSTSIWVAMTGKSYDPATTRELVNSAQYTSLRLLITANLINNNVAWDYQLLPRCCILYGRNPGKLVYDNLTTFDNFRGSQCVTDKSQCNY